MSLEIAVDVIQIIFADIVLSGDNALVIGMAAAGLSREAAQAGDFHWYGSGGGFANPYLQ